MSRLGLSRTDLVVVLALLAVLVSLAIPNVLAQLGGLGSAPTTSGGMPSGN